MIRRLSLLISLSLGLSATVSALPVGYYTTESRLSSGHWVKIRTEKEAIYQLTYDQLRGLGFSDPSKVQVYGYGALTLVDQQFKCQEAGGSSISGLKDYPDDLRPVATRHTPDGRILFFGEGDVRVSGSALNVGVKYGTGVSPTSSMIYKRTYDDTASYYFLSDVNGVVPITERPMGIMNNNSTTTSSHLHIDLIENEVFSPADGGSVFHEERYKAGSSPQYTFNLKNYDPSTPKFDNGTFYYEFAVGCPQEVTLSTTGSSNVEKLYADDTKVSAAITSEVYRQACGYYSFKLKDSEPDNASVSFNVNIPHVGVGEGEFYCASDYVLISYPRKNVFDAENPYLIMNLMNGYNENKSEILFNDIDANSVEMWDIDYPWDITSYESDYNKWTKTTSFVLDHKAYRTVAFNSTYTFPTPEVVDESVANQNLHGLSTPDMLIITTAGLLPYAEQLADIHRTHQNMDVLVVKHDDIYNEFSSGVRSSMAYRRMAKMFYDRDKSKFKYLLFFGPASFDNRCISVVKADRLMSIPQPDRTQNNSILLNYPLDALFGMMNDRLGDGGIEYEPYQIAVGRVPAIDEAQAATYVEKVKDRFEKHYPAEVYNTTLLMSGPNDNNTHHEHEREVRDEMTACRPSFHHNYLPMELFPQGNGVHGTLVDEALKNGVSYMSYSGHGSSTAIAGMSVSDVNEMNYEYPPFVMLSSCDQFAFDHLHGGLIEALLFKKNGGAIAGVAASRSVYISYNQMTCLWVARAYANAGSGSTLGQVFMNARNDLLSQNVSDLSKQVVRRNLLAYNLAGDPAIPVGVPERNISLNKIGGVATGGSSVNEINPYVGVMYEGSVCNADGTVDTGFNGTVRISILDGEHDGYTRRYIDEDAEFKPKLITIKSDILLSADAEVKAGRFATKITVPVPTYVDGANRIVMTANSTDGLSAAGSYDNVKVTDYKEDVAETEFHIPVIRQFYLVDKDMNPVSELNGPGYVCADIDPTAEGLDFRTGSVNSTSRVTVDGFSTEKLLPTYLERKESGDYFLKYPVGDLAEGSHTIELRVVSNFGESASAALDFNVVTRTIDCELIVEEPTASNVATIAANNLTGSVTRLIITNDKGETVRSIEAPSMPYKWNLKDENGTDVPDGAYKVSVLVNKGRDYGNSRQTKIVVLR